MIGSPDHIGNDPDNPPITDLDLRVYTPSGALAGSSLTSRGNVEIVQFPISVSGNYSIVVSRYSGTVPQDAFAIAWW